MFAYVAMYLMFAAVVVKTEVATNQYDIRHRDKRAWGLLIGAGILISLYYI